MEYEEKRLMIIELGKQNTPMKEIAAKLGYSSVNQIRKVLQQEGIEILTPIQAKCVEMRKRGMLYAEIAEAIGKDSNTVRQCCVRLGIEETEEEKKRAIANAKAKQAKTITKTDKEVADFIEEKLPWCEYAGGYTGCDGFVNIRCKRCGTVYQKSMVSIRHGKKSVCKVCRIADIERAKAEKKSESEKIAKEKAAARKASLDEKLSRRYVKVCKYCGNTFETRSVHIVYCSADCRRKYTNTKKDRRIAPDKYIDKDIMLASLYKRDDGICYLCGGKCNYEDYVVRDGTVICGDWYPSIDHVIPIAKGGEHSWKNVRLAHRKCNTLKRDAVPLSENAWKFL